MMRSPRSLKVTLMSDCKTSQNNRNSEKPNSPIAIDGVELHPRINDIKAMVNDSNPGVGWQ